MERERGDEGHFGLSSPNSQRTTDANSRESGRRPLLLLHMPEMQMHPLIPDASEENRIIEYHGSFAFPLQFNPMLHVAALRLSQWLIKY